MGYSQGARAIAVPHPSAVALVLTEGRFTLRACNLMIGQAVESAGQLVLHNEWTARQHCPGLAGRLDTVVHEAARGPLRVRREPGVLRLVSAATGATLRLRATESRQPPPHAVQIGELDGAAGNCRVLAATTERGPRLYVLARTRLGGPWRLLPGGPTTPDDGAVRGPALDSLTPGSASSCIAGFGPNGPYVKATKRPGR